MKVVVLKNLIMVSLLIIFGVFGSAGSFAEAKYKSNYYNLVMSNNDDVCDYIDVHINENVTGSGVIRYFMMEEFASVNWQEKEFTFIAEDGEKRSRMRLFVANFDIDNDGFIDNVAKKTILLSGHVGSQLFVFKSKPHYLDKINEITYDEFNKFTGFIFSYSYPYTLDLENIKIKKFEK